MTLEQIGQRAKEAEPSLRVMNQEQKDQVLLRCAEYLVRDTDFILNANEADMENGKKRGMKEGLLDRLKLTPERIEGMAEGLRQIAELPDPIGEVISEWTPENGLDIQRVRVPLGVIGIIYEARPNVTADAFGLCFKTGNPVVLRGGSDAVHSNKAIVEVIQKALADCGSLPFAIQLLEDTSRETAAAFMKLNRYIDVLIPRGSAGLIATVVNNSTIPVIETGSGNCHVYVDDAADLQMAADIVYNAPEDQGCLSAYAGGKAFCKAGGASGRRGGQGGGSFHDRGHGGRLGHRVPGLYPLCKDCGQRGGGYCPYQPVQYRPFRGYYHGK